MADVPAHDQPLTVRLVLHYPAHDAREHDPHYRDFEAYRRAHIATASCAYAATGECAGGLELHHRHVEFALLNGIDLSLLEADFPGIGDPDSVGAWIESDANFEFLCARHHRGPGGAHTTPEAIWQSERYVRGLVG